MRCARWARSRSACGRWATGSAACASSSRRRATTACLELLLGSADLRLRYALDLRDLSWDGVEPLLAERGAVRVGDRDAAAGWRYLRFREPPYDEAALRGIAREVAPLVDAGVDVFAFFRHEDEPTAPAYARRLLDLLAG